MKDIPEKPAFYSGDVGMEDGKLETHRLAAVSFESPPCRPRSKSGDATTQGVDQYLMTALVLDQQWVSTH